MIAAFDKNSWRRLYRLAKPFFFSQVKWRAWGMLALLLTFLVAIKSFDVVMSYVGRDFMTALSVRKKDDFIHNLFMYLIAFGVAIPLAVFYRYTEERLALMWRRWLSHETFQKYFAHRAYYRLAWYEGIDNPDQRIEEDVRSFTTQSLSLFLIFLQSGIAFCLFIGVLSSISWALTVTALGYALIGSVATYFLGRPLIALNYEQLKREADYRYKLIKVRDNSESIAFYRGENIEKTRVRQRLREALRNLLRIIDRNRTLNFFTTGYNYLVIILPTIVVAPLYFNGDIEFGVVTQSAVAFGHVLNALSVIVLNFGSLSSYAAVVRRLGAFMEALDDASNFKSDGSMIDIVTGKDLEFKKVTILTPDRSRALLKDFSLTLPKGGLLISGASGAGKSAVLRAVAGLWRYGSGTIVRPNLQELMFVPQRPYLVIGSLRSQLLYGQLRRGFTDRELIKVLRDVELEEMLDRVGGLESCVDFSVTLSNGEQQRIGIARAVLAKSRVVLLDEATTAIDSAGEKNAYERILSFAEVIVSVGFKANLAQYHQYLLEMKGDGTQSFEEIRRK